MAEDVTQHFKRTDDPAGGAKPAPRHRGSTIFNTSVRGWISLMLVAAISLAMFAIVIAPYFGVSIPTSMEASVIPMFAGTASVVLKEYFQIKSREGQSEQPPTTPK